MAPLLNELYAAHDSSARDNSGPLRSQASPPESPSRDLNVEGATTDTFNQLNSDGQLRQDSSVGDQDGNSLMGDLRDNSSFGHQGKSPMGDLGDNPPIGDKETALLPETRGKTHQLEIPGESPTGQSRTMVRREKQTLRQLHKYLSDAAGQEALPLDRTRAQTRALHVTGLLSEDSSATTGSSSSNDEGQLVRHLQETIAWYVGLMANGQGEPIGQPLVGVEPAPISDGQAIKSIHKEL